MNATTEIKRSSLNELEDWQLGVFTAALAERMFPNYALFSRVVEFGNVEVMRGALDKAWDRLCQRGKGNFETQLERVEPMIPEPENYDMYGVYPALDAAVSLCATLNQMENASAEEAANISQLSQECVATYLEVIADPELSDEELVRFINTHELMEQELEFQQRLFSELESATSQKAVLIDQLRSLAENEGVSNIGICDEE